MKGLLWFDDDKTRTLEEKIQRAIEYYNGKHTNRFGAPNICHVSAKAWQGDNFMVDDVEVSVSPLQSLRDTFLLGVRE